MEVNVKTAGTGGNSGAQHWVGQAAVEKLRDRGQGWLNATVIKAQQAQGAVVRAGREAADSANDFVSEKPWRAVALSAGAGILLGWLLSRK